MNASTRNALLLVLLLMTGAMFYGFSQGSTPDLKALLALMYGLFSGMAVCVVLLVVLPALELARKTFEAQSEKQAQN
jgi:zinc transporter ZupT